MTKIWNLTFHILVGRWGLLWAALIYWSIRFIYGRPLSNLEILLWATVTFIVESGGGSLVSRLRAQRSAKQ